MYNSRTYVDEGYAVLVATEEGQRKGVVKATVRCKKGSQIANFIDVWNHRKAIRPVLGTVEYFPATDLDIINESEVEWD